MVGPPTRRGGDAHHEVGGHGVPRVRCKEDMNDPVAIARDVAGAFEERADHCDRDSAFPSADIDDLRAAGLLGLMVPVSLGGMGASFATYAAVAREIATGSGATALVFNMHASVTGALATTP